MADPTTITIEPPSGKNRRDSASKPLALVIAWSAEEPERVGEVAVISSARAHVLGRGLDDFSASAQPLLFAPRRKAGARGRPVTGAGISRRQLEVTRSSGTLELTRVGRCPLVVDGATVDSAVLSPGDVAVLHKQLVLLCVRWFEPPVMDAQHAFGEPDAFGLVGESYVAWSLRDRLAFIAKSKEHVLLLGPTGSGKELAARSLHGLSPRAGRPLVSRNAATLPEGIIDAELFGNLRDYPNAGTPERKGLIGASDSGTLFLDEIGELAAEQQAHLLRVLDNGGEYQRLGEERTRTSDFRLVAATNRSEDELKRDLLARFAIRLEMPRLDDRVEDIPLIVRHLARRAAAETPELADRFLDSGEPRIAPELVVALLRHRYQEHVRELNAILWRALTESRGDTIELSADADIFEAPTPTPEALTDEQLSERLAAHDGNVTRAAASLGISRHALRRLLNKRGITA